MMYFLEEREIIIKKEDQMNKGLIRKVFVYENGTREQLLISFIELETARNEKSKFQFEKAEMKKVKPESEGYIRLSVNDFFYEEVAGFDYSIFLDENQHLVFVEEIKN